MSNPGKYLIVYDVSQAHERERVSRVLEGFGFRVQESVFECLLSTAMKERLLERLRELGLETGFVLMYRINESAKRIEIGKCPENPNDDSHYAYVV